MKCVVLLFLAGSPLLAQDSHSILTDEEHRAGWRLLFNGRNLDGWIWTLESNPPAPSWTVEDGLLRTTPERGKQLYLLTRESFSDFELAFEWKAEAGANSGVKYRFQGYWSDRQVTAEPAGAGRIEPIALEYQIADDERHPDALSDDKHSTAALYEYWTAVKPERARAGLWHRSRIVARGKYLEHWLDGRVAVSVDLDAPEVKASFAQSRRRGSSPLLANHERRRSPIALQFHDGIVWFRNIKIRELDGNLTAGREK